MVAAEFKRIDQIDLLCTTTLLELELRLLWTKVSESLTLRPMKYFAQ